MSSTQPILITGAQRSGTTLLHLILNSHPQTQSLDETDVDPLQLPNCFSPQINRARVAFKLPTYAHEAASFAHVDGLRILWCLRDPRDVVASMLKLQIPLGQTSLSWAKHPWGSEIEIQHCATTLGSRLVPQRYTLLQAFGAIQRKPPQQRSRTEAIFAAALCWRLKQELLPLYDRLKVRYHVVRYERLVTQPQETIREILSFLSLPWHEDVLRHHHLHTGTAIGETDRSRPIDATNVGKGRQELSPAEREIVCSVCSDVARPWQYDLDA